MANNEATQALSEVLSSNGTDLLIRKNNEEVLVSELDNKIVGLYFSEKLDRRCKRFNALLLEAYDKLKEKGMEFEVVLVSQDETETEIREWLKDIPWLALPFKEDRSSAVKLRCYFDVQTLPGLVIIGQNGETLMHNALRLIAQHGIGDFPFTPEKLAELAEADRKLRKGQTLKTLLVCEDLDFIVDNSGMRVNVAELVGIPVLLFFSSGKSPQCQKFLPKLIEMYKELKNIHYEDFEVVFVSSDLERQNFVEHFSQMPWYCLPYEDTRITYLNWYFYIEELPTVVVIGNHGETVTTEGVEMISVHGADAFPFDEDRMMILREVIQSSRKRLKTENYKCIDHGLRSDAQDGTSSSIFLPGDYFISNHWKVLVSELDNKILGLYFWKSSDENCRRFNSFLIKTYYELKRMGKDFEVVLISQDLSETQFRASLDTMPWLALPFKHKACAKLVHRYDLRVLPTLVILRPDREVLMLNAVGIIEDHGSSAYPFNSERIAQLDRQLREAQTLKYLLCSEDRDFLVDNLFGPQQVSDFAGKSVLIFFSAEHIPQCKTFLTELIQTYDELLEEETLEVVFVSRDRDVRTFDRHFSKMKWLALPCNDKRIRFLLRWFDIGDLPRAVVIGPSGKTTTLNGVNLVMEFGAHGIPFTSERITIICYSVPVSDLENKPVGLYFSEALDIDCVRFNPYLLETYNGLRQDGMAFEVVLISQDESVVEFGGSLEAMPWLAMPFDENISNELRKYFRIQSLPGLVIIGPNGKTLIPNAVDLIKKHGSRAYPFTPEKLTELDEQREEEQTLEKLLISEDYDFLMHTFSSIEKVSNLVGKHVLLFFSAGHFPQSVTFLPKLIQAYNELKASWKVLEVVFVSCDLDHTKFIEHYAKMPWLALPYDDERIESLKLWFDIKELPRVVVIGPCGRTVTTEALYMISVHGAKAFPFDETHLLSLRKELTTLPRWPKKCWSEEKHEHLLVLAFEELYECSVCSAYGICWCYHCEVKVSSLVGKIVCLYFSGSWCGPCRRFTPKLVELYKELASRGNFEVAFISSDKNEESFTDYFAEMPWLAIPFSDLDTGEHLNDLFKVRGIPNLVIIDENGIVSTEQGTRTVIEYGVNGYPFTPERINFLKEEEEAAKRNQTLSSILVSSSRDYVISNNGNQVPVCELEGKTVGIYFSMTCYSVSREFTPVLVEFYKKLKEKGHDFEIVLVSLDQDEERFKQGFETMPWLALPFNDKSNGKLARCFELRTLPTLVLIGPDGRTLNSNVAELIEEHGIGAYPFTPAKLVELAEIEKAKLEAQTLESLLVSGSKDFVIEKSHSKVPIFELVGKTILLYFSAHWCPPCRAFLPKLIKAYHDIKAKDSAFEVIFISSDCDQSAFDEFFSSMPWLALPYGDERKKFLQCRFKIHGIPEVVAIGPSGQTLTKEAQNVISAHGADAYPFTEEHLKQLVEKMDEVAKECPEKVKHESHIEHELVLTRRGGYSCDGCGEAGCNWSFYCDECDFDLHPNCALKNNEETKDDQKAEQGYVCDGETKDDQKAEQGYVCDGDVCHKV
ncbi:hypothetical protein FNV43_RR25988 [Rhamnella rubrinervis]|uniref:protein-disulfide reductase n=1 Tax=Rhamnella rubrinervis TaxID=2594499 RepID=A0A8K0DLS1_9ROSA|nr:hypothetical protein FNV43_RR25988 [Rhamnella rubrinervis]